MQQFHITKEDKQKSYKALGGELEKLRKSIPRSVFELLETLLRDTSKDTDVTVDAESTEFISPNEAAVLLQASRPYVRKLIDEGVLHTHKIGSHFRVSLAEVKKLKASWEPKRVENLNRLNSSLDSLISETGWEDK